VSLWEKKIIQEKEVYIINFPSTLSSKLFGSSIKYMVSDLDGELFIGQLINKGDFHENVPVFINTIAFNQFTDYLKTTEYVESPYN
jgi:hypothetical protein